MDLAEKELAARIERAIQSSRMEVHYQPRYCVDRGMAFSFEALLRWEMSPAEFIPVAEKAGLIPLITEFVVERVCCDLSWFNFALSEDSGSKGNEIKVSINVSPSLLLDGKLSQRLQESMHRYGIAASSIELEITETESIKDQEATIETVAELRARGHEVALDDFGVGYAGLFYLDMLPVTAVKIDRHFVDGVCHKRSSERIIEHIVNIAGAMGVTVVAEGVENEAQLKRLVAIGVHEIQGFLLGRPVPLEQAVNTALQKKRHFHFEEIAECQAREIAECQARPAA